MGLYKLIQADAQNIKDDDHVVQIQPSAGLVPQHGDQIGVGKHVVLSVAFGFLANLPVAVVAIFDQVLKFVEIVNVFFFKRVNRCHIISVFRLMACCFTIIGIEKKAGKFFSA